MSPSIRGRLFRLSPQLFGTEVKLKEFLEDISTSKIVILGEYHGETSIIQLQTHIQNKMAESLKPMISPILPSSIKSVSCDSSDQLSTFDSPKVRVIMEHFSLDMQKILDDYQGGSLTLCGLKNAYRNIGTEGHAIEKYFPVLEAARLDPMGRFHILGGFIPRTYARLLMKEGVDTAVDAARRSGYISPHETLQGTDDHYNFFEGLLTGRNIHDRNATQYITDRFRSKMFPAQILKDASMAYTVKNILQRNHGIHGNDDKILIVCGVGHMLYSHGVPERIFDRNSMKKNSTLRVACLPSEIVAANGNPDIHLMSDDEIAEILKSEYGGPEEDAADVCFLYTTEENEQYSENLSGDEKIREETKAAYDKVGSSAHLEGGDMVMARKIMNSLGYSPSEINVIGKDIVNYQGVGCPHRHVKLERGEYVLDMGSGLGVDSILSVIQVGPEGKVFGIDLSLDCVNHANKRATERGLSNLSFSQSSLENIQKVVEGDGLFDAVISNGAFCLAPNKKAGFSEAYRVLKPGGRIAICTTVIRSDLDDGVEWPLCMQTFAKLDELEPMLNEIGFENIDIDMSDSKMEMEDLEDDEEDDEKIENKNEQTRVQEEKGDDSGRYKVHNEEGQKQYRHLENFDMNKLCARVVIKATKRK